MGGMWECPACDKRFIRRGLWHSCGVVALDHHFRERPRARELFDAFCAVLEQAGGPARLSVAKTRIGFITGITFAAVMPRKRYLRAGFLLRRKLTSPRFARVEYIRPYTGCTR